MKTVAILIVNYNGLRYLPQCLTAAFTSTQTDILRRVYIVDNASTDNSVDYITKHFPQARLISSPANLGYAGGNQLGWQKILSDGDCDYIFLLNEDAYLTDNCLTVLSNFLDQRQEVAAAQPKILLWPETNRLNSIGNRIHFLGFGYTDANGVPERDLHFDQRPINYCSGAAVMLRPSAVEAAGGLFDPKMFMYSEDLDLGWRLRLVKYLNYFVPESKVYHQYEFDRSIRQVYYLERNRLWVLLKNYRALTLVLLLPAILVMEMGQILFAWKRRWLAAKWRSYGWLVSGSELKRFFHERRQTQTRRQVSDRTMLREFTGQILFQPVSPLLLKLANPIFAAYLALLRLIVVW